MKDELLFFCFHYSITNIQSSTGSSVLVSHLYLSLFSRVFDGLEDVPGVSPSHLCAGYILTVPSLNQDSSSYG